MTRSSAAPDVEIERLARFKRHDRATAPALGPELIDFYQNSVQKRQVKFGKIADCWTTLVPSTLADHCALESFTRGSLTVVVDSASHLYELKQLLLAGLEQQLMIACKSAGLRKLTLKRGQWCDAEQRVEFNSGRGASPQPDYVRHRRRRDVE
jgi:hypothetical protein